MIKTIIANAIYDAMFSDGSKDIKNEVNSTITEKKNKAKTYIKPVLIGMCAGIVIGYSIKKYPGLIVIE